jgi:hypothetical protein
MNLVEVICFAVVFWVVIFVAAKIAGISGETALVAGITLWYTLFFISLILGARHRKSTTAKHSAELKDKEK